MAEPAHKKHEIILTLTMPGCYHCRMLTIGFSLQLSKKEHQSASLISQMLDYGCQAIEIDVSDIKFKHIAELHHLLKKFKYLSVHATEDIENSVEFYEKLNPDMVTVHPEYLPRYLNQVIPNEKISVENMDWRHTYGRYPEELKKIFKEYPELRFTCDLNHVYTNDLTMELVNQFNEFKNLSHYHISGFKDASLPHCPLYKTKQRIIAEKLEKTNRPIIVESFDSDDINNFRKEFDYIVSTIEKSKAGPFLIK